MTRKLGDMGLSVMGSRHVLNITYPAPDETLLETPEALPTSEPETPQIEFTIAAAHLPNIGGASAVWTPILYAMGQNGSASSRTLSYRLMKNDASVSTGSISVSAGRYWTVSCFNYYGSVVGDVIQLRLWASGETVDWRYKALAVFPTRLSLPTPVIYRPQYTTARKPVLTLDSPGRFSTANEIYIYNNGGMYYSSLAETTVVFGALGEDDTYGFFRVRNGDVSQNDYATTSTISHPSYYCNNVPTQIVYYPLAVR